MQYTRDRLWLKHKYRNDSNECPRCHASIRWVCDGSYWIPCDKDPVYYIRDRDSKVSIVKRKSLIDGVVLFRPGMELEKCEMGLLPHVFSCTGSKGEYGCL